MYSSPFLAAQQKGKKTQKQTAKQSKKRARFCRATKRKKKTEKANHFKKGKKDMPVPRRAQPDVCPLYL